MNATARPVEAMPPTLTRALPAWVYNHPEMSRLEYERILRPSWQLVCHVSSVARPGDYVAIEIGRESIVVLKSSAERCADVPLPEGGRREIRGELLDHADGA